MTYDEKPADKKIVQFLETIDYAARPAEIVNETGLSQNYVTARCRVMAEEDILVREEGGAVIGHDIPGMESPVILKEDQEFLLNIVREHAPNRLSEVNNEPADKIRDFIKKELATSSYPLPNRKVSYAAV